MCLQEFSCVSVPSELGHYDEYTGNFRKISLNMDDECMTYTIFNFTVFHSHRDNKRVIMKEYAKWHSIHD